MSRCSLTCAITALAIFAAVPAFAQITGGSTVVYEHPAPGQSFPLAEAYPGTSGTYSSGILPNRCWSGPNQTTENVKSVPGIFCLEREPAIVDEPESFRLNVNAFATCGPNEHSAVVQSYRLKKEIPGSMKCPQTYPARTWWQFGSGVRTWWTLLYTQPGTKFILEVTVRCLTIYNQPKIHIDRWTWEVVADLNTLEHVIHSLHQGTLGTLEIPCIAGEDMFKALMDGLKKLRNASGNRAAQQDALFNMEALVIAYTAFGEFVDPEMWFPSGPPSNLAPLTPFNIAGLIDTLENPCGCKLIADLEYIGTALGIVSL